MTTRAMGRLPRPGRRNDVAPLPRGPLPPEPLPWRCLPVSAFGRVCSISQRTAASASFCDTVNHDSCSDDDHRTDHGHCRQAPLDTSTVQGLFHGLTIRGAICLALARNYFSVLA